MSYITPLTRQQVEQQMATELANALQASNPSAPIPNTGQGAPLGATFRAASLQFVQNQNNLTAVENRSRLQSSYGQDVDSFINAFDVERNGASPSSGSVTLSNPSPASQELVQQVGLIGKSSAGVAFTVLPDNSQPGYNAALNGYVIAPGASSVTATVVCNTPGTIGNVLAGQISVIFGGGGVPAVVQSITNAEDFTNGTDIEPDPAVKARFTNEVAGQQSGTDVAIAAAIQAVQSGLTYTVGDMINASGAASTAPSTTTTGAVAIPAAGTSAVFDVASASVIPFGSFIAAYDGTRAFIGQVTGVGTGALTITNVVTLVGSGTLASGATLLFVGPTALFTIVVNVLGQSSGPSSVLIAAVDAAVQKVRPAGTVFSVIAPTLVIVNGVVTVHVASNANQNVISAALTAAYDAFLNNIGLDPAGDPTVCSYFDVAMTLREIAGVNRVDGLTLNSGTSDITAAFGNQIVAGTLTITFASP